MAYDRNAIREGQTVYTRDGHRLGSVARLSDDIFEIEKGYFFPREYLASYQEIAEADDERITLSWTKEQLEGAQRADMGPAAGTTGREELRMPLAEEELEIDKQRRKAGEVRLRKEVHTEERNVNVPVTREEVHVERVPASEATTGREATFREGEQRMPVYEEEVEVTKRPVIREEVRVSKEAHRESRPVHETIRREEAEAERDTERTSTWSAEDDYRHP